MKRCDNCGREHIPDNIGELAGGFDPEAVEPKRLCAVARILAEEDFISIIEDYCGLKMEE